MAAKARVLVVDDSSYSLARIGGVLGPHYELITAEDGIAALHELSAAKFDLVVTDLVMPGMTGWALLSRIRNLHPSVAVVVCSADVQDSTRRRVRELGALEFVAKPVNDELLRSALTRALEQRDRASPAELESRHRQIFRDNFRVGAERAAVALSSLVFTDVAVSVPEVEVLPTAQLRARWPESASGPYVDVTQRFSGAAEGYASLLVTADCAQRFIQQLTANQGELAANEGPSALERGDLAMLAEIGNIVLGSLMGTMGDRSGIEFSLSIASCVAGDLDTILRTLPRDELARVVFADAVLSIPGYASAGSLMLVMDSLAITAITRGFDALGHGVCAGEAA